MQRVFNVIAGLAFAAAILAGLSLTEFIWIREIFMEHSGIAGFRDYHNLELISYRAMFRSSPDHR